MVMGGLSYRLDRAKQATGSYIQDRVEQVENTLRSYVLAIGFFAAAGVFATAAICVGLAALFRWVELHYGPLLAFGTLGSFPPPFRYLCSVRRLPYQTSAAPWCPSLQPAK
jgi:hypothetical protein